MPVVPAESLVAAAVLADDPASLPATIEALGEQVYGPARVSVIGGGADARRIASSAGLAWEPTVGRFLDGLEADVTHVWFLHAGVVPRPDALLALVRESGRVDAGIAGSKLLDRDDPGHLLAVGLATDVFVEPYTGLDPDERDQGQFEVLRDVAALSGASLLVRRDLALGLGGPDPRLTPLVAAIDLCHRARLRGARVVVVPSSEVLGAPLPEEGWRDVAGRLRTVLKIYGPLTLAWVVPSFILVGVVASIVAPFAGRWLLFRHLAAWGWNLVQLPGTIRGRLRARRGRLVDDAELFRYQVPGPLELRRVAAQVVATFRRRWPGDDPLDLDALGKDLRSPVVVGTVLAGVFLLVALRNLWSAGLPAIGHSLPIPSSTAALDAYAGGWHPGGFGGTDALVPFVGFLGLLRLLLLDSGRLAAYVLVAGSYVLGWLGVVRFAKVWGIRSSAALLGGVVYVAGSATQGIAAATALGALAALGAVPWVLRVATDRWPKSAEARLGRIAAVVAVTGLAVVLEPAVAPFLVGAGVLLAVFLPEGTGLRAAGLSLAGVLGAVPMLYPWLGSVDPVAYLRDGSMFWTTSPVVAVAFAGAFVLAVAGLPTRLAAAAGWGGVLVAVGSLVARSPELVGRAPAAVGLLAASLGAAVVVGAVGEGVLRVDEVRGWRRVLVGSGTVGVVVLVAASLAPLLGGRGGLPGDHLGEILAFTGAGEEEPTAVRALLVGDPRFLPGDAREFRGSAYRVVSTPMPDLREVTLPGPGPADAALAEILDAIAERELLRGGAALGELGIRWVVVVGEDEDDPHRRQWLDLFAPQLDFLRLGGGLAHPAFAVDAPAARARTSDGDRWRWTGVAYEGMPDPEGRVLLAENPDPRWGPGPWRRVAWGNEVSAASGVARYTPDPWARRTAFAAVGWFLVTVGYGLWGRRRS